MASKPFTAAAVSRVLKGNAVAVGRAYVGDAAAHQAGAQHADALNFALFALQRIFF